MAMLNVLIALAAGAVGGLVAGLMVWRLLRQRHGNGTVEPPGISADVEEQINRAAAWWARVHNRPGAAPLVARKLRLTYGLNQRRRSRKRWSR
jgi:hypothetical protein